MDIKNTFHCSLLFTFNSETWIALNLPPNGGQGNKVYKLDRWQGYRWYSIQEGQQHLSELSHMEWGLHALAV